MCSKTKGKRNDKEQKLTKETKKDFRAENLKLVGRCVLTTSRSENDGRRQRFCCSGGLGQTTLPLNNGGLGTNRPTTEQNSSRKQKLTKETKKDFRAQNLKVVGRCVLTTSRSENDGRSVRGFVAAAGWDKPPYPLNSGGLGQTALPTK